MSRSDNMPARRPPAPQITTAPMRCADSKAAAAARSAVGSMDTRSPPKLLFLAAKIVLTFMAASLRMIPKSVKRFSGKIMRQVKCTRRSGTDPRIRAIDNDPAAAPVPSMNIRVRLITPHCMWLMPRCIKFVDWLEFGLGIEPGKQQQPGQKAADMGLPGNHLAFADQRHGAKPE